MSLACVNHIYVYKLVSGVQSTCQVWGRKRYDCCDLDLFDIFHRNIYKFVIEVEMYLIRAEHQCFKDKKLSEKK